MLLEKNNKLINYSIIQIWVLFSSLVLFIYLSLSGDESQLGFNGLFMIFLSLNIIYNFKKLKLDTSKALFWVMVSFFLYHVAPLLFYNFINVIGYMDADKKVSLYQSLDSNILTKTFLMSTIGFQSTLLGYVFTKINYQTKYLNYSYDIYIVYVSIAFLVIGTVIRKFIGFTFFSSVEAVTFLIISIYVYSNSNLTQSQKKYLALLTFFISLILFASNTTGRRDLIKLVIVFSVLWSIYIKPFKLAYVATGGMFSIFIMISLVLYRTTFSITHVWSRILLMFENTDYLFLMVSSTLDFMPGHNNYEYILGNVPNNSPYLYGSSLMKIFYVIIPRQLWLDKPSGVQELIVQQHDNLFVGGTSQTTTMIGEFYWNFGLIGVVAGMAFLGYVCKRLDFGNKYKSKGTFRFMLRVTLISWFIEFFRGGMSTTLVINSLQIVVPVIVILLSYNLIKRLSSQY